MGSYFPTLEDVETPLGRADEVWATSETHIGMRGTFTVNRVAHSVRLDLHFRDGAWQEGSDDTNSSRFHAFMIDRDWDWSKGKRPDTSWSARNKARDALVPWLAAFAIEEGAALVREAGKLDLTRKIASAQETIAKLRSEIATAEADLALLLNLDD